MGSILFPPIVDTYTKPCIAETTTKYEIPFTLSNFNKITDIADKAILTISSVESNYTVITNGQDALLVNVDKDKMVIELPINEIENIEGKMRINKYYRVQLRFISINVTDFSNFGASWIINHQNDLSEWSTITLIRAISQPILSFVGYDETISAIKVNQFASLIGSLSFANSEEKSVLKQYRILVPELDIDSNVIYPSLNYDINQINYTLTKRLPEQSEVLDFINITIEYSTDTLYSDIYKTKLIVENGGDAPKVSIVAKPDIRSGNIKVVVQKKDEDLIENATYSIVRTSSKHNWSDFEIIKNIVIKSDYLNGFTLIDNSVESGVYYKYGVCFNKNNQISSVVEAAPAMCFFDDMYLSAKDKTLKIKLNPTLNSFKQTILESKNDTLGSKYPFIKRNGDVNYKQFPIGGLISFSGNDNDSFVTKIQLFGNNQTILDLYNSFNEKNNISDCYDYILEKEYRNKVMDFLYKDDIKLFRSLTEGNILVKLMDINFSPNASLGRLVYSFTANAIEVDDCTAENLSKYGIEQKDREIYSSDLKEETSYESCFYAG